MSVSFQQEADHEGSNQQADSGGLGMSFEYGALVVDERDVRVPGRTIEEQETGLIHLLNKADAEGWEPVLLCPWHTDTRSLTLVVRRPKAGDA